MMMMMMMHMILMIVRDSTFRGVVSWTTAARRIRQVVRFRG